MQMTTEARLWLDATVRRILARHPLGDAERAGITYELMSHLHAAGEARARAAGRGEVAREDLEAALAEAGGEERLAAAFVKPLSKPLVPAGLPRRAAAFAIDVLLLGIAMVFLHGAVMFLSHPVLGGAAPPPDAAYLRWLPWVLPWGYHPEGSLGVQAAIGLTSAAIVLGYFTWTESQEGRSLGKRALGLRVMRVDGRPMTPREALLRNVAKLSPALLIVDALVLLLMFPRDGQRASDRLSQTIVVQV
jgi:uncharacterized RDD family membrane protein YckC